MSHIDVLIYDGDHQLETGPSFSKYWRFKLFISASNVPISRSTESHRLRPETEHGMDWM